MTIMTKMAKITKKNHGEIHKKKIVQIPVQTTTTITTYRLLGPRSNMLAVNNP